jgi:chromosome segregation ATPase
LKKLVLRTINVYTYRQILFNAAVVRILNRWDARLQTLSGELSGLSRRLADRANRQVALIEERRSLWESRLAGQLGALEDRTSAAESDVAELASRARAERMRLDSLEDSVRRLEAHLARERETAGAGTPR